MGIYSTENTGCSLHHDCLTCPYSECVLVLIEGATPSQAAIVIRRLRAQETYSKVVAAKAAEPYVSTKELARRYHVSESTVGRLLAEARKGGK